MTSCALWPLRRGLAVLVTLTACRNGAPRHDASDPSAIVVAPAQQKAGAGALDVTDASPDGEGETRLEVAMDYQRLCVRSEGRVHCTKSPAADVPLTAAPAEEGIDDAVSLSISGAFGCVATRAGKVLCFGDNTYGQLGAHLRGERSDKPVVVAGVSNAKRVVTSEAHACALLRDDTVRCWGANDSGQTGGATYYLPAARELVEAESVERVSDVATLALGRSTACAATRDRNVTCWGRALFDEGRAMHGRANANVRPVAVADLAGFEDVAGSDGSFCGITRGEVKCWGELWSLFSGEKARGSKLVSTGVTGARKVTVTPSHACALLADGTVTCWGNGSYGALGRGETGDTSEALAPETVRDLSSVVDIAAGGAATCAVTGAREVYCWGTWPAADGATRKDSVPVKMRID